MPTKVTLKDNSDKVISRVEGNRKVALNAMGIKAVNLILRQMQHGYGKPIRKTGDLQRDVNYKVENSGPGTVDVGNTLEYSVYVHEGTSKMKGRPYITDALNKPTSAKQLQQVAEAAMKQGLDGDP